MTSVKEFRVDEEPTAESVGAGRFVFTDAYSVFDWGQMPDTIPGKGASLCTMSAYNFGLLEVNQVPTHYRGVVEDGEIVPLGEARDPPTEMAIELTQVPDLPHDGGGYDYDAYHAEAGDNYLIPLEIVFRNVVPEGSSLRDRGEPRDYELDYDEWPDEPVSLPRPVVEFSTKFEEQDRYLDREEAEEIAGKADLDLLEELATAVNHIVSRQAEQAGLVHEDGKIECMYHDGALKVADAVGTFDENRFSYDGQEVSKEVIRQYYKRTDPEWVAAVSDAKARAKEQNRPDWRSLCGTTPHPLPDDVLASVADMYMAGTNAYTDEEWFEAPDVAEAVDAVRSL